MKNCKKCGAELSEDMNFCSECGAKIDQESIMPSSNSATPANTFFESSKNTNKLIFYIIMAVALVSVIVVMIAIILSGNTNKEAKYLGTWDVHSVSIEGSLFTIEEIEAMGDYTMSDFRIIIKEGGKAYVYSQGDGDFVDWSLTEEGISIGIRICAMQDDMLTLEINSNMIYLAKTSSSQTISNPDTGNTHTHIGGIATCTEKAICSVCNKQYGKLNSANHSSTDFNYSVNANDNTKHDKKYSCCGIIVSTFAHSGGIATTTQKAKCEYCNVSYGNVLSNNTHTHTGGVATCTEKAFCSICNEQYGEYNSTNHSSTDFSYSVNNNDSTKHDKKYSCCGIIVSTVAHSGGTATTTQKARCEYCNTSYGNVLSSFNWQLAGNGCGARIPEPSFEYDVKASSTYLCVEVYNTTEEDFYDYVNECRAYGFNGTVGSATSPDLYYMVYDAEEYYLEVFYYADEEYFYVYIRPPYGDSNDNSDDDNTGDNDNENGGNIDSDIENDTNEITAEELLLAKTIAEDSNLSALETKERLISYGISEEKASRIVERSNVQWNKQASHRAENFAVIYATVSPNMIADLLHECGFTDEEVTYAVSNCGIDWKWYAVIHAEEYELINEDEYYISPLDVKIYLELVKGYTVEDSEYAVKHCDVDWNKHALLCLNYFVEKLSSKAPSQSECIQKLSEWGFNDSEIEYALENYGGIVYPDKLDYIITFDANGGHLSTSTLNVVYGKPYTLPIPTKTGYTFTGWYNGYTKVNDGTWYMESDIQLKAQWELETYSISYNLNDGTNNSSNPSTYTSENIIVLGSPERTGYTFTGWTYSGQTTPVKNVTIPKGTTGNKTYTANWQANTYTVTYKVNGGTLADLSVDVVYGSYFKPATPTRTGYTFNGWHYDSGKGYDEEYCNDYYGIAGDVTLEAWWNANAYTITYNANGGTVSGTTQSVTYDGTYTLRTPTRTGYEFLGWYNGGNKVENGTWTSTQGITLKAEWKANTYTITFNANSGTVSPTSATATYDSTITLPTPTRTGYTFSGWYNGSTKYTTGTWKTAGDTMLTAKWTARTDITYVVNHYQQNIKDNEYTLFETQNLKGTADASIKPATNSYTGFTAPTKQTVTVKPDGSLVVNYYYTRNSYSITFVTNGGDTIAKITQKYQSKLSVPDATRNGYTFGGWFTNATLTTSYTKPTTMPATSRTVYAYWAEENKPSDFTYSGSSAITVSAYKGTSTTMWIPSYIGGKAVTTISSAAFENKSTITKVIVPETVTTIGSGAFKGCSSIEDITLPFVGTEEYPTYTGNSVFGAIFGTKYVGGKDFDQVLTSSTLEYTTQYLEADGYLSGYLIPDSIRKVTITKQTAIPANAFRNCDLIEEINIPNDTVSIGEYTFYNCTNVVGYNLDNGVSVLPTTLVVIPKYAFANNHSLSKILLSSNIESIGGYAFSECKAMTEVKTAANVAKLTSIGNYAFSGCIKVKYFFIGNAEELIIPTGVTALGERAFENNAVITKVIVPETVTTIGSGAFKGCSSIEDITLPFVGTSENPTYKGSSVFGAIFGTTYIGGMTFKQVLTSSTLDYTTQYLEPDGYLSGYLIPDSIKKVTITKQTAIPSYAFRNCDLIEEIVIPDNVLSIGEYAFYNCSALTNIYIPNTVETIGSYAFTGCTSLTINCGATSRPTGWASNWNSSNCEVAWNKSKS